MRAQEQGRRGSKLREALQNLEAEEAKLRGAELAVEDLLKLKKPNLALLQARRDGIKYQHKMIAQFQAEADALIMAPRLETGAEGPGEGDNPSQIEPDSPVTSRTRASILENRRAFLVELASRPGVAVQDRDSMDTPEHLRPKPLDGRVAPPIKDAVHVPLTADAPKPRRHRGPGGK